MDKNETTRNVIATPHQFLNSSLVKIQNDNLHNPENWCVGWQSQMEIPRSARNDVCVNLWFKIIE